MPSPAKVELEDKPCPLGCPAGDDEVLTGHDRLHELPGTFTVVKCRACELMRTNPRPTQRTIGFYYPQDYGPYQSTQVALTPGRKIRHRWWKQIMRRVFDTETRKIPPLQPGRMLEIGCASGAFLRQMAGGGWEVEGLEFSEKMADAVRTLGYPMYNGTLESMQDPVEPYDLIVGWHVLEHLHDPIHALRKLHCWSKSGGWLAVSMPDASALEFKIFKDRWYGLDLPRHLFHYTPKTLSHVLGKGGWKVERILWHHNPNNLLQSLRYCSQERGWSQSKDYLLDLVQRRRHRYLHLFLAKFLGTLHASGRMTVWARRF